MYNFKDIKSVHIEVTDKCNAACPMCARNIFGGKDNPLLPITELTLEDVKKIFSKEFVLQLEHIYMCGNYGDPIVAKETSEIFEWFRSINSNMTFGMHTNRKC